VPVDRPTPDDGSLRRYLRDLVAVSTLSAIWSRRDPQLIAQSLADVICRSLPVAITYVGLGKDDASRIEAAGAPSGPLTQEQAHKIGNAARAIADPGSDRTPVDLFGAEPLYVSITPIGLDSEFGMIVVGSRDPAFPSSVEQLLLSVPANQAAVVLQQRQMQTTLRELVAQLQDADRRKDEFLATLAHELRNPLAPVLNSISVVRQCGTDRALIDRATDIMDRQLSHMVRLIDDLLDAARITTGKLELRKARVDLATLMMNAVEANRPMLDQMGHELKLVLPPHIHLYGDPVRLTQVISNLLNNAAKYTDLGGQIVLAATQQGPEAIITVKDSGVGIPAEMQKRIFDRFAQVDRSLTRSQGGLGLGLTLVKQLIELHGGTVSVRSAGAGTGSEFTIRVPVAQDEDAVDAVSHDTVTTGLVRLNVLVVDDNVDAAESLATILRLDGIQVMTASDGHEALRLAESTLPEVVILDIGLPGLDGYEVARRIRRQPWGAGMLLVALSGWGQPEDKRRSAEAGLSHHLVKPVNPLDIARLLAEHGASINN
jgi:signal transduction histidine kinase/ActR/RegA family two-component response regulator